MGGGISIFFRCSLFLDNYCQVYINMFPMWEKGGIFYGLYGSIQGTYHVYFQWLLQDRHTLCGYQRIA